MCYAQSTLCKSRLMTKKTNDMTLVGYARVSTIDQSVSMQIEALKAFGVREADIYSESMSGTKKKRPALTKALRALRKGDTLVVWKLDRIARSINHLLEVMQELDEKGVAFRSLTEGIETETPGGRCILHVMGSLAQFERDLIVERTRAGVANALAKGVKFGAKHKIQPEQMPEIWSLVNEKGMTKIKAADKYGVSVQTISRRLKEYEESKTIKE